MPPRSTHPVDTLDDDNYPTYTTGRAAEILGTTPAFLRTLDNNHLITPQRPQAGHRHYTHHPLRTAARARHLVNTGTHIQAACHIITLQNQLKKNPTPQPTTTHPHHHPLTTPHPAEHKRVSNTTRERAGSPPRGPHCPTARTTSPPTPSRRTRSTSPSSRRDPSGTTTSAPPPPRPQGPW
ncbi:helix-turn-helix domain-containing protein [Streptomyces lydicus]|uniref:helix-turn-helix domain-containing protein n=1 Tax=Streptomyces lydicus TaxID=47763 RepID=UPI0028706ACD|nr:helix-turn-helix domain-containing protein [Streptomyces lydicus]